LDDAGLLEADGSARLSSRELAAIEEIVRLG
jgi:hypothetical protein